MPQLILNRQVFSDKSTIGELIVDQNVFKCWTLEDTVRRVKVFGETAIPAGLYRVVLANSPHFGFVPHILDVPFYEDVLIHSGNSDVDTRGCILVGQYSQKHDDWIGDSRATHKALMDVLIPMNKKEALWLDIRGGIPKDEFHV